jgi:dTDP-4-amino-4,6-dideoxygalactose transaminase
VKLKYLDGWNEARRQVAQRYNELLALWNTKDSAGLALSSNYSTGLAGLPVTTPYESPDVYHLYYQYTIRAERRDALAAYLKEWGIGTMVYYPVPLHLL